MNKRVIIFWTIIIGLAGLRVSLSLHQYISDIGSCLKHTVYGYGTIVKDPSFSESGQVLVVKAQNISLDQLSSSIDDTAKVETCSGNILIRMKTKLYPRFHYADQIYFSGNLSAPFNFKSNTGRAFDYKGYLAKEDIFYEIKSAQVISDANENANVAGVSQWITSVLYKIKRSFVNNLNQTLGEPHSALAAGLVVGEKSALGKDLLNDFRTVGLIHIVVLSGFNITIVADALRRLLARLPRLWGIVIGGIGMILFGVLVGGGATVVRSCFMASIALGANIIRRDYHVARALLFAGCLMLIQNPLILLHDPSFQLSFLATLGLILLATPLEKVFYFVPEKFGMRGIFAATFATQIFVSPFILYMMGQISIIGVVANILVLPFIPLTMLAVFLTGALGLISSVVSQICAWGAHLLLTYELFIVESFARVPYASLTFPQFSGWWVVGFYVVFFVIKFKLYKLLTKFTLSSSFSSETTGTI
ncbi:MAG: ComEC/Rec2 family competence protein [Candidatus Pacebacteria bacterium]|nr:ComEC/Rec2 family competence protein [Candidatus Paceibacterota bacterium]